MLPMLAPCAPMTMDWTPDRIRALRKRLGLNQDEFAEAMGYGSNSRISELENGHVEPTGPVARLLDHLSAHGVLSPPAAESKDAGDDA